jgi:hypothetical protein
MILGTSNWFSNCWIINVATTTQIILDGAIDNAITAAGMAPNNGPIMGTASITPAKSAKTRAFGSPIIK